MNRITFKSFLFASCLALPAALPLAGCDDNDTAEEAGEHIDDAIDDTGDALENAGEKVEDGAQEAGDEIDDATDGH